MPATTLTFLGAAAVLPAARQDTACFLINGCVLFDTGWCAALKMLEYGHDPMAVEHLIFTHCHHDHYLGLPALLFYRAMMGRRGKPAAPLKVIGPPSDLALVVERARQFLQVERFSEAVCDAALIPLPPGQVYETPSFRLETAPSRHNVEGMVGRFTDLASGAVIAFSGDTGLGSDLPRLARGADILIHEASWPPEADDSRCIDHSRATDAARCAGEAGVKQLRLVHLSGDHAERSLAAAHAIFPNTELAVEGEAVKLGSSD
jgi:ribonuclease Z